MQVSVMTYSKLLGWIPVLCNPNTKTGGSSSISEVVKTTNTYIYVSQRGYKNPGKCFHYVEGKQEDGKTYGVPVERAKKLYWDTLLQSGKTANFAKECIANF